MGGFAARRVACPNRSHHFKRITIGQAIAGKILHVDGHGLAQSGFVPQPDPRHVSEIHIVLVECSRRSGINQDGFARNLAFIAAAWISGAILSISFPLAAFSGSLSSAAHAAM